MQKHSPLLSCAADADIKDKAKLRAKLTAYAEKVRAAAAEDAELLAFQDAVAGLPKISADDRAVMSNAEASQLVRMKQLCIATFIRGKVRPLEDIPVLHSGRFPRDAALRLIAEWTGATVDELELWAERMKGFERPFSEILGMRCAIRFDM